MNRKRNEILERRRRLLEMIRRTSDGEFNVAQAAEQLGISPVTLRRDLTQLEAEGRVRRSYGRVSMTEEAPAWEDPSRSVRNRIALAAAAMVEPGDVIYLNADRLALRMLPYIEAPNVTVITSSALAAALPHRGDLNLILTGGEVRYPRYAMTGSVTRQLLQSVQANKAFLGCDGLSVERGVSVDQLALAAVDWLMLSRVGGQAWLLATHDRLGRDANFVCGGLELIRELITDRDAAPEQLQPLRDAGLRIRPV